MAGSGVLDAEVLAHAKAKAKGRASNALMIDLLGQVVEG
jgi:hypothetical protein